MSQTGKRRFRADIRAARKKLEELLARMWEQDVYPGFDYAAALRELNQRYSLEQIAENCFYKTKAGVAKVMNQGVIPDHPHGEAIYILYVETFNKKPPNRGYPPARVS